MGTTVGMTVGGKVGTTVGGKVGVTVGITVGGAVGTTVVTAVATHARWREKRTWQAGGFAGIGGSTHLKLAVVMSPLSDVRGVPHLGLDA